MDRGIVRGNRLVHGRWEAHLQNLHKQRLSGMRARVDNKAPTEVSVLKRREGSKKVGNEVRRLQQIEYQNFLLLRKMERIDEAGNGDKVLVRPGHGGTTVDDWKASRKRQKERRLTEENVVLLERLEKARGNIDHSRLSVHYEKFKYNVGLGCEYPPVLLDKNASPAKQDGKNRTYGSMLPMPKLNVHRARGASGSEAGSTRSSTHMGGGGSEGAGGEAVGGAKGEQEEGAAAEGAADEGAGEEAEAAAGGEP